MTNRSMTTDKILKYYLKNKQRTYDNKYDQTYCKFDDSTNEKYDTGVARAYASI